MACSFSWLQQWTRTVELEQLIVAGFGGQLLAVNDSLLERFALSHID
jgi:hypothetical protein